MAKQFYLITVFMIGCIYFTSPPRANALIDELDEASIISGINAHRTAAGSSVLHPHALLHQAAATKAQDIMTHKYWSHVSTTQVTPWSFIDAAGYRYLVAGENLARNFSTSTKVVTAWFNSPAHKQNMLDPAYTDIGVSVVYGDEPGEPTTLIVALFGKPLPVELDPKQPYRTTDLISDSGAIISPLLKILLLTVFPVLILLLTQHLHLSAHPVIHSSLWYSK